MRRAAFAVAVGLALALGAPVTSAQDAVHMSERVKIVMSDGIRIDATVFSPAPLDPLVATGERLPVLVTQSPYRKPTSPTDEIALLVGRGYIIVATDVRGTGHSEGEFDAFSTREQIDGKEVVEWAASQPWSDGKVGLYGESYLAINQYLTAAQHPEGLVAMAPVLAWSDMYEDFAYRGGSMGMFDTLVWVAFVSALKWLPPTTLWSSDGARDAGTVWARHLTSMWAVEMMTELASRPTKDAYYTSRSPSTFFDAIAASGVHVMHVGGWEDLFTRGMTNNYAGIRAASQRIAATDPSFVPGTQNLVMGPWNHWNWNTAAGSGDERWSLEETRADWFDRWLKGTPNGIDEEPPVRLWVRGADAWIHAENWPPFEGPATLYLRGGPSGTSWSLNDGVLGIEPASGEEPPDTYVADAASGVTAGPTMIGRGFAPVISEPQDQRLEEAKALTYTTAPFAVPVDLAGPITLVLHGSTTAPDTDWVARLLHVATDGATRVVSTGWLRASHREGHDRQVEVTSEVYRYEIEIWPTALRIAAGERLRVSISSSDVPLQAPNAVPGVNAAHRSADRPSMLHLPLRPA